MHSISKWCNPSLNRCEGNCLSYAFYKAIIHGESALEFPSYIKRRSRQLRSSHNDKLIELRPKTEAYRNSFYCRTIKEWNSLPSNVLSPVQTDATLLDVTCCVRLHTLLHVVRCCCVLLLKV